MNFKKALLATTLTTMFCSGVNADFVVSSDNKSNYDISLGGTMEAQAGTRIQEGMIYQLSQNNKYVGFDTAASMHASVKYREIDGWVHGAQLGIRMNTRNKEAAGSDYLDRTYLYIEHAEKIRMEFGTNTGAASAMKIAAGSVAAGTGGINGAWSKYASIDKYNSSTLNSELIDDANFIQSPKMVLKEGEHENIHERYRKITIYIPFAKEFKFGVSYGPDGANVGGKPYSTTRPSTEDIRSKNPISAGLSWKKSLKGNKEISASVVGEYAKYNPKADEVGKKFNDYKAVMVGAKYVCDKISFAGSYGNHFKSKFKTEIAGVKNGYVWSAGVGYNAGKTKTSLTYLFSDQNSNILHVVSTGLTYELRKDVTSYAEVTYFNADQKNNYNTKTDTLTEFRGRSNGVAIIMGAKLVF